MGAVPQIASMGEPNQETERPESLPPTSDQDQFAKTELDDVLNEDTKSKGKIKRKVIAWISSSAENEKLQEVFRKLRIENTGQWLFEGDRTVSQWLMGGGENEGTVSQRAIWLHGADNFGKTILVSSVIDRLEILKAKEQPCIPKNSKTDYFYCQGSDGNNTYLDILKGILCQMVEQDDNVASLCHEKMLQEGRASLSDTNTAESLIKDIVQYKPRHYIIIDGLDKCKPVEGLQAVRFFAGLVKKLDTVDLRVMFMSRHNTTFEKQMAIAGVAVVALGSKDNAEDIKAFVELRLSRIALPSQMKTAIEEQMCSVSKSIGSFLYAVCAVKFVEETAIEDLLEKLGSRDLSKLEAWRRRMRVNELLSHGVGLEAERGRLPNNCEHCGEGFARMSVCVRHVRDGKCQSELESLGFNLS